MTDSQHNARALAKRWRDRRPDDFLKVATQLSREGVPDAVVEETVRILIKWHRTRMTDPEEAAPDLLEIVMVEHALDRREWQDSDAELMGVFPVYLRRKKQKPQERMVVVED